MQQSFVLDASALLAFLFKESGAPVTEGALDWSALSSLNYSEVIATQIRRGGDPKVVIRYLDGLDLPSVPWDADLAREAADLSSLSWTHGLSLGDRACLATARRLNRTALTAERGWRLLPKLGVDIKIIR